MPAPVGILPFDSTDSSIILRTSLTSAASVAAPAVGPAGVIYGTAHTFDSRGFRAAPTGNSGIRFSNPTGFAALDNAGQISFEISREVLCALQSSVQSSGTNPGGPEWVLTWDAGGAEWGAMRKIGGVPSSWQVRTHNSGDTGSTLYVHSENKPEMVRVTTSWIGGLISMWIDGAPIPAWTTAPTRVTRWANQFQNISVMCFGTGSNPSRDGFMRNLIISSEPVMLPRHPLKRVAFLGHSFSVSYSANTVNNLNYDVQIASELRKLCVARGFDVETNAFGVGGAYWDPAITAFDIRDYITAAMASLPNILVLFGGTNDVGGGSFNATTVDTEIKAALTTIAGNAAIGAVERIVFCTTPTRFGLSTGWTDVTRANIVAHNASIRALPVWWNATFPAQTGKLVVADAFSAWGGMDTTRQVMAGQRSGAFDDLHPNCLGSQIFAQIIGEFL